MLLKTDAILIQLS